MKKAMVFAALAHLAVFSCFAGAQEKAPAAAAGVDQRINKLQETIKGIEKEMETYNELKARLKETSNALAELNKKLSETDGEITGINKQIVELKTATEYKNTNDKTASDRRQALTGEQAQKIDTLETELGVLRGEIIKIQEKITAEKEATPQKETESAKDGEELKDIVSSPWVGFTALIIAIVALFTPI